MASLVNVPTEVFYYYAKYIDLLDFGALLFTCKDLHNRLHEDLVFKKVVFDQSPFTIKNPQSKSSVRRKFIEYNAQLALRNNDPDALLFYFPTLACDSIIQQLRPVSPELQKKLGRANLLEQIDAVDADKVLAFIIESFIADLPSIKQDYYPRDADDKKSAVIIELLFMLGDQFLKPTDDINELKQRPERKTTLLVLELFKKYEDHAWVKLADLNKKRQSISQSYLNRNMPHPYLKGAEPYLRTLFYFQEKYPQYKFNVNHPIGKVCISSTFINGTKYLTEEFTNMTVTDYIVAVKDFEMLEFIVEHYGGKLTKGFPHLWLSYERFKNMEKFQTRLLELGTDPNAKRGGNLGYTSFLYYYLLYSDQTIDCTEHIKRLVAYGARFANSEPGEVAANRDMPSYKHLAIAYDEIKKIDQVLQSN